MKNWQKVKVNMEKNMCVSFAIMPKKNHATIYCPNSAHGS